MNNRTRIPDGEAIARLRTEKGWSQEDLLKRINEIACETSSNAVPNAVVLTPRTIARVEAGQRTYLRTLRSIAAALGVDVSAITKQEADPEVDASEASQLPVNQAEDATRPASIIESSADLLPEILNQFGYNLDYSLESLTEIDRSFADSADSLPLNVVGYILRMVCCYFGEVLRKQHNGCWEGDPTNLPEMAIRFPNGNGVRAPSIAIKCLLLHSRDAFYSIGLVCDKAVSGG